MDPQRDRIYIPHAKDPVEFPKGSPELLLLQRIRDEAHRFGLTYHKRLRQKKGTQSIFDNISGIGNVRRMALLKHFGGLDGLKEASLKELMEVPGISKRLAENIHNYLHSSENNERESKKS
jgi:excinuclease ABC subunit C